MKTATPATTPASQSHASWPFPAAGHFRRSAAAPPPATDDDDEPEHEESHAERELVEEQRERDRKAAHAVDPNKKDRPAP